ncbi:MAG TPA: AIR synthase-related protein, partial [Roseiflexaceae bacterium]|nr:AIR synthase-related protein [Roseiflexaceae bacterium]
GGAHVADVGGADNGRVPCVDLATAPRLMKALHDAIGAGLVRACHDISEGGLGVALAEMAIAGRFGAELDLRAVPNEQAGDAATLLFSESPTRFVAEVRPEHAAAFEAALEGCVAARIGSVLLDERLIVTGLDGSPVIQVPVADLQAAWQATTVV